jgi:hypothetical protein
MWLKELDDEGLEKPDTEIKVQGDLRFLVIESTALWHSILCGRLFSSVEFLRALSI